MSMYQQKSLEANVSELLHEMTDKFDPRYGLGSMTCSVYDTAWVAMISCDADGQQRRLFPQSFQYLLDSQQDHGGWQAYPAPIDGILNTMAALLALSRKRMGSDSESEADLGARKSRAYSFLATRLYEWDILRTVHVGFEILVPVHLDMLEGEGVTFEFPGKSLLMELREQKLRKIDIDKLYGTEESSAVHSLEGLIGRLDFDRLSHRKSFGSMMASPSSTAAYLMNCSTWDKECESYLHHVIDNAEGDGNGSVPSAYPTTLFEMSWVISTLLESGFATEIRESVHYEKITNILEGPFQAQSGLVGFSPLVGTDADDTAKVITSLNLLGRPTSAADMVRVYETQDHFKTYNMEKNPSFSTNCNVLKALLTDANIHQYVPQIEKVTAFLCNCWWDSESDIEDKWNLSPQYSIMVMAQSLTQVTILWIQGCLPAINKKLLQDRVVIVLFQALVRILDSQHSDGSWGNGPRFEATAYGLLVLAALKKLPFVSSLLEVICKAIKNGQDFLAQATSLKGYADHIWVEKVTYGSRNLFRSYIVAALKVPATTQCSGSGAGVDNLTAIPFTKVSKFGEFFSRLPLFHNMPQWKLHASLIESYLYLPQLESIRHEIFSKGSGNDKYFEYIPFTWIASANLDKVPISPRALHQMMVVSILNYQADEFMEIVVGNDMRDYLDKVQHIVANIFDELPGEGTAHARNGTPNGVQAIGKSGDILADGHAEIENAANGDTGSEATATIHNIDRTLRRFVGAILKHKNIASASPYDRSRVRAELQAFLLAHITQAEDNNRFQLQEVPPSRNATFDTPHGSYYNWVHTTSADHTSCPYSFAFFACLLGNRDDFFRTAEDKYLGQDLCRHLATLCRMYNDYGSLIRDRAEKNLNSVNFPEFTCIPRSDKGIEEDLKESIMCLAHHERACMNLCLTGLDAKSNARKARLIKLFCNVTDTYGQIYVLRDIGVRTKDINAGQSQSIQHSIE